MKHNGLTHIYRTRAFLFKILTGKQLTTNVLQLRKATELIVREVHANIFHFSVVMKDSEFRDSCAASTVTHM